MSRRSRARRAAATTRAGWPGRASSRSETRVIAASRPLARRRARRVKATSTPAAPAPTTTTRSGRPSPAPPLRGRRASTSRTNRPMGRVTQGVLAHAGERRTPDGGADVEAGDVVGEGRSSLHLDPMRHRVDPGGGGEHHPRAGAPRQRNRVDLEGVRLVVTRHEARDHPRVDRLGTVDHQREPDPRQRTHHEAPQHLDVGVSGPDEHQVSGDGFAHRVALQGYDRGPGAGGRAWRGVEGDAAWPGPRDRGPQRPDRSVGADAG